MFRSLLRLAVWLLVSATPVIDIQAAEIPEYEWQPITMTAPWHPRQYHDVAMWDNLLWVNSATFI